jgi:hypothetical protein
MSQKTKVQEHLEEYEADEMENIDLDESDYGFIVSSTGELKTFFCPESVDGFPPKEVLKIFKLFKINNVSDVLPRSGMIH